MMTSLFVPRHAAQFIQKQSINHLTFLLTHPSPSSCSYLKHFSIISPLHTHQPTSPCLFHTTSSIPTPTSAVTNRTSSYKPNFWKRSHPKPYGGIACMSSYNGNFESSYRNHINVNEAEPDPDMYFKAAQRLHKIFENNPERASQLLRDMKSEHFNTFHCNLNKLEDGKVKDAEPRQLRLLALSSCIPFIGFGFVDNFVMIIAGDLFDTTLCVLMGFSTMAAAALGNLISDLLGIGLSGWIEKISMSLGFPTSQLTKQQLESPICRRWYYTGSGIGMAIGCILGMIPLLFLDTDAAAQRKRLKAQSELFGDVMKEMAKYMRAEKAILYIVDKERQYFRTTVGEEELTLPLDAGIPGEAFTKRKLINWHVSHPPATKSDDVPQEAPTTKFPSNELSEVAEKGEARQILGAPVFGVTREVIGVVEVVNPVGKEYFTRKDKEFLIAICSHLAMEIEGKHHITNILGMCRKQVGSRRTKLPDSNKSEVHPEEPLPTPVKRPWEDQEIVKEPR